MTLRRLLTAGATLVGGALLLAGATLAQRFEQPYGGFPRGPNPYAAGKPKVITQPGQFDYYLLSLSWSPSYCAGLTRDGYDPQCHRRDGKRYSFVLHGLWPQFERGWPQDCPTADRGFVPRPTADRMLDIMPSDKLVFHEYRKHGTCSGLSVDGYFDLARKLYGKVTVPSRYQDLNDPRFAISPTEMTREVKSSCSRSSICRCRARVCSRRSVRRSNNRSPLRRASRKLHWRAEPTRRSRTARTTQDRSEMASS